MEQSQTDLPTIGSSNAANNGPAPPRSDDNNDKSKEEVPLSPRSKDAASRLQTWSALIAKAQETFPVRTSTSENLDVYPYEDPPAPIRDYTMAPVQPRRSVGKDSFSRIFGASKTQTYHDPASRGPGSHSIRTLAWSPTGSLIATGAADRTLRVWNPERAQVKNSTELRGHGGAIERVAWNPTMEAELASTAADGTVRFWDVRSKAAVADVKIGGEGLTLAWAPDGSSVLAGRKDDTLVIIEPRTWTASQFLPQNVQTNQIIFSHGSRHLFLTTGEGRVKIIHYPEMETLHTINAHTSACFCLQLCPRANYLAVGGSDALITMWDTRQWYCKYSFDKMTGPVRSLSFSFDGNYIVGGSDEGTGIEIGHVESGEYVHTIQTSHPAPQVAWHPYRYWLAYSGDPSGLKIVGAGGGTL